MGLLLQVEAFGWDFINSIVYSKEMGSWSPGTPSILDLNIGVNMETLKAKKVYKFVSVVQPPFLEWNETTSRSQFNFWLQQEP